MESILPPNAHELAHNRLHVSITNTQTRENSLVSSFSSREDLIKVTWPRFPPEDGRNARLNTAPQQRASPRSPGPAFPVLRDAKPPVSDIRMNRSAPSRHAAPGATYVAPAFVVCCGWWPRSPVFWEAGHPGSAVAITVPSIYAATTWPLM